MLRVRAVVFLSFLAMAACGGGGGSGAPAATSPPPPLPAPRPPAPTDTGPLACVDGMAGEFPCSGISLAKRVDYELLGKTPSLAILDAADVWGWHDEMTSKEYALVATTDATGIAFVDVTNPEAPVLVANLAASLANQNESGERDVKVYQNHAYVVAGSFGHGMQVFDLTRLRDAIIPETFQSDALYTDFGEAKNIAINEATGFAYVALSFGGGCNRGLHIIDITTPNNPMFAGCYGPGVILDAQCVIYDGPDTEHVGREICIGTGPSNAFHIGDVTDKTSTVTLSTTTSAEVEQFANGWLTEDHRYYLAADYKDEAVRGVPTRTHVFDVADLDAPVYLYPYEANTMARDRGLFIRGNRVFQANYAAGLRVLEIGDLAIGELTEVAFFDTAPLEDTPNSGPGANGVYPFLPSGTILVNDEYGLFIFTMQ